MSATTAFLLHPSVGYRDLLAAEADAHIEAFGDRRSHRITDIPPGAIVVPRFRAVYHGAELADDVEALGARLVNTWAEHRWAADLGAWYQAFADITPITWRNVEEIPVAEQGPFIVKGETTSLRHRWSTHCYAADRSQLGTVIANALGDTNVAYQHLYIRRFVPLASWGSDVVGMPIADEYRLFFVDGVEVARGFYWVNHFADIIEAGGQPNPAAVPDDLVIEIGRRLNGQIRFAAVDAARTADDTWTVIEINDGSQAGLCGVDPHQLWSGVVAAIDAAAVEVWTS